ncbi:hypothetical protein A2U01_0051504, partial [Trifolium medium]|nr:hypothetical protein [Trifolium medium]
AEYFHSFEDRGIIKALLVTLQSAPKDSCMQGS